MRRVKPALHNTVTVEYPRRASLLASLGLALTPLVAAAGVAHADASLPPSKGEPGKHGEVKPKVPVAQRPPPPEMRLGGVIAMPREENPHADDEALIVHPPIEPKRKGDPTTPTAPPPLVKRLPSPSHAALVLHPHGPDEPCHTDGRLYALRISRA